MMAVEPTMSLDPPERLNITDHFLDARIREGRGARRALLTDAGALTYDQIQTLANRFGHLLMSSGAAPEQRVLIALPDGPDFVGAFFGALKIGAVVVMVNPGLSAADVAYFLDYTRARVVVTHRDTAAAFLAAIRDSRHVGEVVVVDDEATTRRLREASAALEAFPSHRDDPAIWLFSGGTTGRPKAVIQTHRSFAFTTECYGRQVIGYREDDITLSVPKLYFCYATGANLLFPFSAGAAAAPFAEPATPEALFDRIRRHRPTVLISVPTMIHKMVSHPEARTQDLSSLRVCTSAGEALPVELHRKWMDTFGVELIDGLGTAEMWHIFISNRAGAARPGTLGTVVSGFATRRAASCRAVKPAGYGSAAERGRSPTGSTWTRRSRPSAENGS
jgi:acyl-coenzyme A synthetase/AMP-(fatty) acid ligase